MTKQKTLINESVVRRWGKLANMPSLMESWLDNLSEEDIGDEEDEAGLDMEKAHADEDYAEGDLERADDSEMDASPAPSLDPEVAQEIAAELASALGDTLAKLAGEEVLDVVADDDIEAPEMEMDTEEFGIEDVGEEVDIEESTKKSRRTRASEELNVDMIDDEGLTEAVLARVIERLLSNKK
jgi:hypothetical protein